MLLSLSQFLITEKSYYWLEEEFYGDVVPGGYNKKSKKLHVSYWSDAESEDLNVNELLSSLHDAT